MKNLQTLMQKEMTRKEFIVTLGFGIATIFGLSALIQLITGKDNPLRQNNASLNYGGGAYGGHKPS